MNKTSRIDKFKDDQKAKVINLMQNLYDFARYQDIKVEEIQAIYKPIQIEYLRKFGGNIGVVAIQIFFEFTKAPSAFQRTALLATLHKFTQFWHLKPQPRQDLEPLKMADYETQAQNLKDAA